MPLTLIFVPEGVEPELSDFRMLNVPGGEPKQQLHFSTMEQLLNYLKNNDGPKGTKPWAYTGKDVINHFQLSEQLPKT